MSMNVRGSSTLQEEEQFKADVLKNVSDKIQEEPEREDWRGWSSLPKHEFRLTSD